MMRKELCSTPAVLRVDCFGMRFELADPRPREPPGLKLRNPGGVMPIDIRGHPIRARATQRHVNTLIVSGGETDVCVLSTVLSAIDLGLRIVLVEGALCSSFDESHDAILGLYR
jgi:hypothetical protein